MNEEAIEKRGLEPLKADLDAIAGITDAASLARVLGAGLRADVDSLNNTNFHTEPSVRALGLAGLRQPGAQRRLPAAGRAGHARPRLLPRHRREVGGAAGKVPGPHRRPPQARRARPTRRSAAAGSTTSSERSPPSTAAGPTRSTCSRPNNPWPLPEFAKRAPGLDWNAYFAAAGLVGAADAHRLAPVGDRSASRRSPQSEPLAVWKDYLTFHAIDRASPLLPKAFADEALRLLRHGAVGSGAAARPLEARRRTRRAALWAMPWASSTSRSTSRRRPRRRPQRWSRTSRRPSARRIDALAWMSPATRAKAKAKLATLYVGIGYPDHWRDYAGLEIRKRRRARQRAALGALRLPLEPRQARPAGRQARMVDDAADRQCREPAAAERAELSGGDPEPAVLRSRRRPARNYGAIGAVIGHEISHSFDDQGAQFDADGRLANWWTPEDRNHFQEVGGQTRGAVRRVRAAARAPRQRKADPVGEHCGRGRRRRRP